MKILLIEDNPGDARLSGKCSMNPRDFTLDFAETLTSGWSSISQPGRRWCCWIRLPDSRGLETLTRFQDGVPVAGVAMTSNDDEELAVQAVRQGARTTWLRRDRFPVAAAGVALRH